MKRINGKNLFSRLLSIAVCAALFLAALPVMNIAGANYDTRYAYIEFDNKVGKYNYDYLEEDHIYFKNDIGAVKDKDVTDDDWNIKVDAKNRTIYLKGLRAWELRLNPNRIWIRKVVLIGDNSLSQTLRATVVKKENFNTLEITTEGGFSGSLTINNTYKGIDLINGGYNVGRHHCGINLYSEYNDHDEYKRNLIISNGAEININIISKSVTNDKGELKPSKLKDVAGIYVENGDLILKDRAKVNITGEAESECSAWSVNAVDAFYGKVIMGKETQLNIDVSKFEGRVDTPRGILSNFLTVNQIDQIRILTGYYGKPYYGREEKIVYGSDGLNYGKDCYTVRNALLSKDGTSYAKLFEIKNKNLDKHSKVNLSGAYSLDKIYDTDSDAPADMYTSNEIYREINTEGGNKTLYIKPMDYSKQGQSFDSWGVRYSTENGTVDIDDNSEESVYKTLYNTLNNGAWEGGVYHAPIAKTINEVDIYQKYKYSVQLSHTDGGGIDLINGDGNEEENPIKAWVGEKPVKLQAVANDDYQFSRWEIYDTKGNKMGETQYGGPKITANLNNPTLTLNYTGQHYEVRAVFELADNNIIYRYTSK